MHITASKDRRALLKKLVMATGIGMAVFLLVLAIHWSDILRVVELKTLDHRFNRYAKATQASPDIVLVAIDEPSLQVFGRALSIPATIRRL